MLDLFYTVAIWPHLSLLCGLALWLALAQPWASAGLLLACTAYSAREIALHRLRKWREISRVSISFFLCLLLPMEFIMHHFWSSCLFQTHPNAFLREQSGLWLMLILAGPVAILSTHLVSKKNEILQGSLCPVWFGTLASLQLWAHFVNRSGI